VNYLAGEASVARSASRRAAGWGTRFPYTHSSRVGSKNPWYLGRWKTCPRSTESPASRKAGRQSSPTRWPCSDPWFKSPDYDGPYLAGGRSRIRLQASRFRRTAGGSLPKNHASPAYEFENDRVADGLIPEGRPVAIGRRCHKPHHEPCEPEAPPSNSRLRIFNHVAHQR